MDLWEVQQEAVIKKSGGLERGACPAQPRCELPGQRARVGLGDSGLGWGWFTLRLSTTLTGLTAGHFGGGVTEAGGTGLLLGRGWGRGSHLPRLASLSQSWTVL